MESHDEERTVPLQLQVAQLLDRLRDQPMLLAYASQRIADLRRRDAHGAD